MSPLDVQARAAGILAAVRAGTHPTDIRKAGVILDGKYDQDFVAALLECAASGSVDLLSDPRVQGAVAQAIAQTDAKQVARARRGPPQPGGWRSHEELAHAALVAARAEIARILQAGARAG